MLEVKLKYAMDKLETKRQVCFCNNRIVEKPCLKCGGCYYLLVKGEKEYLLTKEIIDKVAEITNSSKSGYEKRIALFDLLESLDVGKLEPKEKKRVDYLLQSRLYSELAKQSMKEYKKLTVESFSKNE